MQAIILAAGMGKRLKELTRNNTKCMIKVNGVTLIDRMLHQIQSQNVSRIVIVAGYEREKLKDYISTLGIKTPIVYIDNPIYDKTNNIYSLSLASDYLCQEDTLLFESDLIFEDAVLDVLVNDPRPTLALVDKEFSESHYVPFLKAYEKALGENEYYEQVLRVITMLDNPGIKVKRLDGQRWYEIDDIQDLDIAESNFAPDEDERVSLLQGRYGGYWRYPKLLDFCYLVNPYFPPDKMKDELRANFDTLLTQYPSGMRVNSLLAAKNFGVHQENILVGNGAAELIKSLMGYLHGKVGFIRPTFEEYPNRYDRCNSVDFIPDNRDYSYTADDIMMYFSDKDIQNLILINPDNPSGNYIPKKDLLRLVDWAGKNKIRLIIDESFADFSDEIDNTMIEQEILSNNEFVSLNKIVKHRADNKRVLSIKTHTGELKVTDDHRVSVLKGSDIIDVKASELRVDDILSINSLDKDRYNKKFIDIIELYNGDNLVIANTSEVIHNIKSNNNWKYFCEILG